MFAIYVQYRDDRELRNISFILSKGIGSLEQDAVVVIRLEPTDP